MMKRHTTTGELADALRALADRLDQTGSHDIAPTYVDLHFQVAQTYAPVDARRRAVDVLAATLDLGAPEAAGNYGAGDVLGRDVCGVTVRAYTSQSTALDPYAGFNPRAADVS